MSKRNLAKQALSAKATEKLNAINADNEGTNEEKATAIQNVTDAKIMLIIKFHKPHLIMM